MRLVIIESPYAGGERPADGDMKCVEYGPGMWSVRIGKGATAYSAIGREDAILKAMIDRNVRYARRALLDSLERGEAPYASHLLYTQVLSDADPEQRQHGLEAGWAWQSVVDAVVVYTDWGISVGMQAAIDSAKCPVEYRSIGR